MTLLGLNDGDNATTGHGYLDIVDFIIQNCTGVDRNLQELYRRVAFNICIGNSDDHFRNHGFLLKIPNRTANSRHPFTTLVTSEIICSAVFLLSI